MQVERSSGFGTLLKRYRLNAGLTQEELAERARLSPRGIQDLERGINQRPRRDTVERLVEALTLERSDRTALERAARQQRPPRDAWQSGPEPRVGGTRLVGGYLGADPLGRLVERDSELARAISSLDAAKGGEGRLIVLAGEAGVGKTRLAQEVTGLARERGFVIAASSCYEARQSVPYYPFLDALATIYAAVPEAISSTIPERWPYLARLLPEVGDPLPSAPATTREEQEWMFRAVAGFMTAGSRVIPLAVMLDDLHWADEASLALLHHLARHTHGERVFLLAAYRDSDVVRHQSLERTLNDLRRDVLMEHIVLRPMGKDGTAALVAAHFGGEQISPDIAELVYGPTGGHPFFALEVLRSLVESGSVFRHEGMWILRNVERVEVPETVRAVIRERVSRLSERAQKLLHEASVLGQTFHFDDLDAIAGLPEELTEEALQEAAAFGLIRLMESDTYAFNHSLTQQALYTELGPRRRRRLHLAIGEALERLPGKERERRSPELAGHLLQADESVRALPYVMAAGRQAEQVFAHGEAERHYRTALDVARAAGDETGCAEALERLGGVLGNVGRYREALEMLEEAARLNRIRGDREGEGQIVARIGFTHFLMGRAEEGLTRIQPIIDELTRLGPSFALAKLNETLVAVMYQLNSHDLQLAAADREAEIARTIGDEALFAGAIVSRAWALLNLGRRDEVIQAAAQAIPRLEATGDLFNLCYTLAFAGNAYMGRGELASARMYLQRALVIAEQIGEPLAIVDHTSELGWIALWTGNHSEAHAYAGRVDTILQPLEVSIFSGASLLLEAYIFLVEGRWDEADEYCQRVAELARRNDNRGFHLGAQYGLATLELWRGQPERALSRLEPMLLGAADDERMPVCPLLAEANLAIGNEPRAEELLTQAVEWARAEQNRLTWADALRVQGLLRTAQRQREEAQDAFAEALRLARFMETRWIEGRILCAEGALHTQEGEFQQAQQYLVEALTIFRQIGAPKDVEQAEHALHDLGN